MIERPILFNAETVRAILDGSKTQIRRPVKPQPDSGLQFCHYSKTGWAEHRSGDLCRCGIGEPQYEPPGHVGDLLLVEVAIEGRPLEMFDEVGRLRLRVTDVRVERVDQITENDAKAEGCRAGEMATRAIAGNAAMHFARVWDDIYAEDGLGWDDNPWVWVVEFERVEIPNQKGGA